MFSNQGLNKIKAVLLSPRLLWGLCCILSIIAVLVATNIVTLALNEPDKPEIVFPRATGIGSSGAPLLYPSPDTAASGEELSEASIKAELLGVISGGAAPRVSMKIKGKKDEVFGLGDEVAPGVIIEAIEPGRVVVRERGALRRISFTPLANNLSGLTMEIISEADSTDLDALEAEQEAAAENPWMTEREHGFSLTPVLMEDGQSGVRVDTLDVELSSLGLVQVDDVILAVDGTPLVELINHPNTLDQLGQRQDISLLMQRDGAEISLTVSGDTLRSLLGR